jgi:hypothetical protein
MDANEIVIHGMGVRRRRRGSQPSLKRHSSKSAHDQTDHYRELTANARRRSHRSKKSPILNSGTAALRAGHWPAAGPPTPTWDRNGSSRRHYTSDIANDVARGGPTDISTRMAPGSGQRSLDIDWRQPSERARCPVLRRTPAPDTVRLAGDSCCFLSEIWSPE